jgi:predicted nucleic acid-binding protein
LAVYYLETSALVKLYVREAGTQRMLRLVADPETPLLAILSLARAELYSAVRRRERAGDIDGALVTQLLDRFEAHLKTRFMRQSVSDAVLDLACTLIDRHPLRAYDALQIAGCLTLRSAAPEPPIFVCADQQLLEVAETESLTWLDPTR